MLLDANVSVLGIANCGLYIKASSEDGLKVLFKAKLKLFKFLEIKNEFELIINCDRFYLKNAFNFSLNLTTPKFELLGF